MDTRSILIACSHGTADPAGRAAIAGILADIRAARPGIDVREAFVDVQEPAVADVVEQALTQGAPNADELTGAAVSAARAAVVVPLLLSPGFHTKVDIAAAVARPGAGAAATLGPDPRLADILVERLEAVGAHEGDAVVLAAAGSSDPRTLDAVTQMRALLLDRWSGSIEIGYGAVASPSVSEAVDSARGAGADRVVIASYLLAPGFFHDRLREAGADLVTAPLAPDPRLAQIALERFDVARREQ